MAKPRSCRVCGCTDDDCSGCIDRTGSPCHWASPRLCSACDGIGPRRAGRRRKPEADFQKLVIDFAHLHGWKVAHFRPARVRRGGKEIYETPVGADGKGWPDLVLTKGARLVAAELKSERGVVSAEQRAWLDRLAVAGVEAHVWYPIDWQTIQVTLGAER